MKARAENVMFVVTVLAVPLALFLPLNILDPSAPMAEKFTLSALIGTVTWFLAATAFWGFKARFWPGDRRERHHFANAFRLMLLQAILLRAVYEVAGQFLPDGWFWLPQDSWVWLPWFLIPALGGIMMGGRFGVLISLTGAFMLFLLDNPGPWPLIGCATASLAGILFLHRAPTRSRVLRAGVCTGITLGIVSVAHYAIGGAASLDLAIAGLVPVVIGFLSAFLVLPILPLLEWVLGELSDVTLVEYGTDHRLLDQLRTEAPGTWHHSLNVGDLAEKAAAEIHARALFCRTAALYHDIGKLKEPALFAENTDGTASPHDGLDPQVSAQKIIEHVTHGLELARKHRLPNAFKEIIAEHHGVSVVRYFYAQARKPGPDGSVPTVDRSKFTYPGPRPSTRESAIIALADAVEAASRSWSPKSEADLRCLVRKLLADRISEGELAESPLTLSDLAKVEAAFIGWLKGRNHFRPAYPETETVAGEAVNR